MALEAISLDALHYTLEDPPKSPLKRGTSDPVPPFLRGARGDQTEVPKPDRERIQAQFPLSQQWERELGNEGKPAIFLDKDGTLVIDVPYNVDPERIQLYPGVAAGVRQLHQAGYALVVVSNQSGVARGYFQESALGAVEERLRDLLGVPLTGFYYCPHHPAGTVPEYAIACACRKPEPGMLLQAAADHHLDLSQSWLIGDILNDVEAAHRARCRAVLISNGNETEWQMGEGRIPDYVASDLWDAAHFILDSRKQTWVNPINP